MNLFWDFCVYRVVRIRVFKVGIDVMCNASPSVTCDAVATQMSQQFSLQQYNCFHQPAASTHSAAELGNFTHQLHTHDI